MSKIDNQDVAIRVHNIKKDFYLPHEKSSKSLKSIIVNTFKKKDKGADIQHVLRGLSFDIKKGEFFGIVGRNGSGKSTLLKILAQIYQPTGGKVEHFGKLVPFIELGVGFNPELSGRENVYLNGALLGFTREEIAAKYDKIVEFAELEDFMDQKLKNYSSGMQVRLAFSVAIQADADILVLDEVLAVGDEAFQRKCNDYFDHLKQENKTVVIVTHSMDSVRKYCDKALMLRDGIVASYGSPEDVSNEYSMENLEVSTYGQEDGKNNVDKGSLIKDLKVDLVSERQITQNDNIEIKISYIVPSKIPTRIKLSAQDIDRNTPLFAADSPVINKDKVSITLVAKLDSINDTNMKISVSIRDKQYEMLYFLPDSLAPTLSIKRTDYPDPTRKTTWALLFDRGEWK